MRLTRARKQAFTLVEVMITLALIGVILACTLPFLQTEFYQAKWTVTYKTAFAETLNALTKMTADAGCEKSLTCTHLFTGKQGDSTKAFGDSFSKTMILKKNCGVDQNADCFSHAVQVGLSGTKKKTLKETMADKVSFNTDFYTFQNNRGVSYALFSFGLSCLNLSTATDDANKAYLNAYVREPNNENNTMINLCGFIIIDVNGPLKPNIWGRDVFGIWITDKTSLGIYPFGGEFDNAFGGPDRKCGVTSGSDTRGCSAQLIEDGWKMTY